MSTFKALLISIICGIILFALTAFLSVAFHKTVSIPIATMVCGLTLAGFANRKVPGESKLWRALAVVSFLAPLIWFVVVVIALARSDI